MELVCGALIVAAIIVSAGLAISQTRVLNRILKEKEKKSQGTWNWN